MTARALWEALRYQTLTPSVTTMGPCSRGCGRGARGSAVCRTCLAAELDTLLGQWDASEWVRKTMASQRIGWDIEEALERLERLP
jgi:hypothetical protein